MKISENFDLSTVMWYQLGGTCKYLLECSNEQDILEALEFIEKNNIRNVFVCGTGANLVFTDDYYDGAVIRIVSDASEHIHLKDDTLVTAFSGVILDDVIQFGFANTLIGLEWAGGLPGTVGAAVRGNVGAFGGEIKDVTENVYVAVIENGGVETRILSNEDLNFSYRTSTVKLAKNMIVLSATFRLNKTDDNGLQAAKDIYHGNKEYRKNRHPLEYPNCGSVFKNISKRDEVEKVLAAMPEIEDKVKNDWHGKVSMGYLIHKLGFAGNRVGGAQVSEKHNNFIVNVDNAKAKDVKTIIYGIQDTFQEKFGFRPEVEVEIVE